MPPFGKHIAGAIAIVNLRGKENFASQQAKKMLAFVKLRLVRYFLDCNVPVHSTNI